MNLRQRTTGAVLATLGAVGASAQDLNLTDSTTGINPITATFLQATTEFLNTTLALTSTTGSSITTEEAVGGGLSFFTLACCALSAYFCAQSNNNCNLGKACSCGCCSDCYESSSRKERKETRSTVPTPRGMESGDVVPLTTFSHKSERNRLLTAGLETSSATSTPARGYGT